MHIFSYFLCYFCTNEVFGSFEYIPKSSFDIKLLGTHWYPNIENGPCGVPDFNMQSKFTANIFLTHLLVKVIAMYYC